MDPFDFNEDGKVDSGESWMAYQIMKDMEKQNQAPKAPRNPNRMYATGNLGLGCAIQFLGVVLFFCSGTIGALGVFGFIALGIIGGLVSGFTSDPK